MYQASVPVLIRVLENLSGILAKGEAHAKAKVTDEANYLSMRLIPDMFPLSRQVQIACDIAKGGGARLAGVEVPSHADTEASFEELQARIAKVIAFLKTLTPSQIDGTQTKDIVLKIGGREMAFKGQAYLFDFILPNVHFHASMTYALLRSAGVELGKSDYLGG